MKKVFFLNAGFSLILFVIGLFIVNQKFDSLTTTSNLSTDSNSSVVIAPEKLGKPISDQTFQKLKEGMTVNQVEKILGSKGYKLTEYESDGIEKLLLSWEWEAGGKIHTLYVSFHNGKMTYTNKMSEKK